MGSQRHWWNGNISSDVSPRNRFEHPLPRRPGGRYNNSLSLLSHEHEHCRHSFFGGTFACIYLPTTLKLGIENPNPTVPGGFLCKKIFDIATFILLNFYFPKPVCKGRYTCVSYISKSKKREKIIGYINSCRSGLNLGISCGGFTAVVFKERIFSFSPEENSSVFTLKNPRINRE